MYMEMELMYFKNILTLTGNERNSCQKSDHQNNPNSHLQHIKRPNCEEQRALLKISLHLAFSPTLHLVDKVFRPSLSA